MWTWLSRAALLCANEGCVALLRAGRVAVVVLGSQLWGGLILKRHYLAPEKAMLVMIDKEFSWLRMLDSPVGSQDVRVLLKGTGSHPLNSLSTHNHTQLIHPLMAYAP